MEHLYKYRGIGNFTFLVDVILNSRLYGAKYDRLNDPFEGILLSQPDEISPCVAEHIKKLKKQRNEYHICSLSKTHNNNLMWSHYAEEHKGCCIELSVVSKDWERMEVDYKDKVLDIDETTTIQEVLSNKLTPWKYEKEVRYISRSTSKYLKIKIHKIYLGYRMPAFECSLIKKIAELLNSDIKIVKMSKPDLLSESWR